MKVRVVMTTHGTSRFKSSPENRDRRRLAWELRASWKMLGFSKRGSRPQTPVCSWLRARRSNGFSRPAVSPWAQWSQMTGAAALSSASILRLADLLTWTTSTAPPFWISSTCPFSLPLPLSPSRLQETWQILAIAKNTNKLSYFEPQVGKPPKSRLVVARRSRQ